MPFTDWIYVLEMNVGSIPVKNQRHSKIRKNMGKKFILNSISIYTYIHTKMLCLEMNIYIYMYTHTHTQIYSTGGFIYTT